MIKYIYVLLLALQFTCQILAANFQSNSPLHIERLIYMEAELLELFHTVLQTEHKIHKGEDIHGFDSLQR